MKKITLIILLLLVWPPVVSAHLAGQPPFFKVDGTYAYLYPVPLTSLSDFPLPQDLVPNKEILVGQEINFELDINRLPAPPEIVKKTAFNWEYGDGAVAHGLKTTHTYTKMGSYLIKIYADDGTTPTPQLLESALINILPNKDYSLPQAVIKINSKESKDPLTDILQFELGQNLHFDATSSKAPASEINSYFWDFGDQQSSSKSTDDHYYPKDLNQVFPVLRVTDANGFIADTYVEVQNATPGISNILAKPSSAPKTLKKSSPSQLPYIGFGLVVFILLAVTVRQFARARGHGKH